ncbi:MAG: Zn-dependent alcohol dehydrogenase [Phototrophicaceae bacterium]|jgi:S-(hydroxymethyl)glutathione dehydrogenase/alcohol dehydrogenase
MKAAVLYEVGAPLSVEEVTLQNPKAHEVLVRLLATGICHSDIMVMIGTSTVPMPVVLGHEGAGVVEAIGEHVTQVKVGDHVVLSWAPYCGECFYCKENRVNLCESYAPRVLDGVLLDGTTRLSNAHGHELKHYSFLSTFAEMTIVPETSCIPVDREVGFSPASLVGCAVTTGIGAAINTAKVKPGSTVAVIGTGGVGLNVIQGAALAGAEKIIALDINPVKEGLAKQFGATHFINTAEADSLDAVRALTKGLGADYAFESAGRKQTMEQAYQLARRGGTVVYIGVANSGDTVNLPATQLTRTEKQIMGSFYGGANPRKDFAMIIDLYKGGKLKLDEMIGARYTLDTINEAVTEMRTGKHPRVVLDL